MSSEAIGVSFLASDQPSSFSALADAIIGFYSGLGAIPRGVSSSLSNGKLMRRAYSAKKVREVVLEPRSLWLHIGDVTRPDDIVMDCFLRPINPSNQEFGDRWIAVTGPAPAFGEPALRSFLTAVPQIYPIAHGGIGKYRSHAHAGRESSFSGAFSPFEVDVDTRDRLHEDVMLGGKFLTRLRRLYPVTIIGPEIWAQLPPMPKVDPAPKVEDLGNCKMLTVWPELVEPRDPAFLAGTKELRRWLWPFTIQNPADALDAVPPEPIPEPFF